jgi:hypothetical protein
MLAAFTIVVVLAVAYAFFLQGLLTAFAMLVNVFIAGLVAFNFWEPIAAELDQSLHGTFVEGYEDWICMIGLFCVTLTVLRLITNVIAANEPEVQPIVQQGGAAVCGALTGYLTAGFIICAMQTLPLSADFLGFNSKVEYVSGVRRFLPSDRVWLALMQRGSLGPLSTDGDGFDPRGYFELGYQRHRRYSAGSDPKRYRGEDIPISRGNQSP